MLFNTKIRNVDTKWKYTPHLSVFPPFMSNLHNNPYQLSHAFIMNNTYKTWELRINIIMQTHKKFCKTNIYIYTWCVFNLAEMLGGILTASSPSSLTTFTIKPVEGSPRTSELAPSGKLPLQVEAFIIMGMLENCALRDLSRSWRSCRSSEIQKEFESDISSHIDFLYSICTGI